MKDSENVQKIKGQTSWRGKIVASKNTTICSGSSGTQFSSNNLFNNIVFTFYYIYSRQFVLFLIVKYYADSVINITCTHKGANSLSLKEKLKRIVNDL